MRSKTLQQLENKLDGKKGTRSSDKLENRVRALEKRTRGLEIKQAGVSATIISAGFWVKPLFFWQ